MTTPTTAELTTLPPPPRAVRRRPGRRPGPPVWVAVVFGLVGAQVIGLGSFRLFVAYLGTPVRATILKLSVVTDNDGTAYRAEYRYELGGRVHQSHAQVSDRIRRWLHTGDGGSSPGVVPARAVRLPFGRAFCLLEDGPLTWLLLALSAGWAAVLARSAWVLVVRPGRQRQALRDGVATPGRIVRVGRRLFGPAVWYAADDGDAVSMQYVYGPARDWVPGRPVTVVYDTARPTRSVAYECGPGIA